MKPAAIEELRVFQDRATPADESLGEADTEGPDRTWPWRGPGSSRVWAMVVRGMPSGRAAASHW